jgi:hypothetical protein
MRKLIIGAFLLAATVLPSCTAEQTLEFCDCGFEKGTAECCDESADRCGDCSKIKGSPRCCVE